MDGENIGSEEMEDGSHASENIPETIPSSNAQAKKQKSNRKKRAKKKKAPKSEEYLGCAAELQEELRLLKLSLNIESETPTGSEETTQELENEQLLESHEGPEDQDQGQDGGSDEEEGEEQMEVEEPYCLVKPNGAIHLYDPQTGFVSEDVSPKAAAGHSPFEDSGRSFDEEQPYEYQPAQPVLPCMWVNTSIPPYYGAPQMAYHNPYMAPHHFPPYCGQYMPFNGWWGPQWSPQYCHSPRPPNLKTQRGHNHHETTSTLHTERGDPQED